MTETVNLPTVTEGETSAPPAKEGSKRQMSFSVLDDGTIKATFGENVEPVSLNPSEVPEATQLAAITEGLISRARGYTSKLQDKDRTPENLRAAIVKAFENLRAGVWKVERVAGDGTPEYTVEVEAAFVFRQLRAAAKGEEYTGTIAEVAAEWEQLTEDVKDSTGKVIEQGQRSKVKALPRYQQALAQVKARRAQEKAARLAKKADDEEAEAGF